MKHIAMMIKPASSLCNLRCKYCFYADVAEQRDVPSYGILSRDTVDRMFGNLAAHLTPGDRLQFAFQGGEPTLAGLGWFEDFTAAAAARLPGVVVSYALQTNGIALDDAWCAFLKKHHFLVGLSLDLLSHDHNQVRVDAAGRGTYGAVLEAMTRLNRHRVECNVLCTLTQPIARHPRQVWNILRELDIRYVQFTPCLDSLDKTCESPFALTPQRFSSFYIQLFRLWLEEIRNGNYYSVKLFDDIVNLLAYGMPTACGMTGSCQPQMVVEADGSVYPCDFYCLDEYRLGSITEDPRDVLLARSAGSPARKQPPLPALCGKCRFRGICGGNCKRMRSAIACGPEDTVCGYQQFLEASIDDLQTIALQQRRMR